MHLNKANFELYHLLSISSDLDRKEKHLLSWMKDHPNHHLNTDFFTVMCPIVWLQIMDAVKLNCISLRVSKRQTIEHIPVTVYLSALAFDLVPFECFHTRTELSLFTPTTHNIFFAVFFFFPTKKGLYYQHKQKKLSSLVIVFIYTKVFFCCSYPKRCYYYYYMWGKQKIISWLF